MITIFSRDAVFSRMLDVSLGDIGGTHIVSSLPAVRDGILICDTDSVGLPSREDIESFGTCILLSGQLDDGEYMGARVLHRPFLTEAIRGAVLYGGTAAVRDTGGELIVDPVTCSVSLSGAEVVLTPLEFSLLELLLGRGEEGVTLKECGALFSEQGSNVTQVYVHYLRKKLEINGRKLIHAHRGGGYSIPDAADAIL